MTIYSTATISITLFLNEHYSVMFVGIFMAMTNVISMLTDVPIGYLQKVIPQKILLIFSIVGVMIAMFIFILADQAIAISFLAVLIYGAAYDFYHITMMSYILDISSPEEYSQSLSQKNVADALGLLLGLLIASALSVLSFINPFVVVLLAFAFDLLFVMVLFDQAEYDTSLDKMDSDMVLGKLAPVQMAEKLKDFFVSTAITSLNKLEDSAHSLKEKIDNKSVIIINNIHPLQEAKKESMIDGMKDSFKSLFGIFSPEPQWPLVWASVTVMFFSLWDTFVTTFMLLFIMKKVVEANNMSPMWSGVIIAVIAAPLFVCQIPFSKLADKIGKPFFIYAGSALSAIAIIALGFSVDISVVLLSGMAISVGYAMAFPAVQGFFAQRFQEHYAKIHNTNSLDSNVSAGPLKTIVDFGNVFAQLGGAALITLVDFGPTFVILGVLLFFIFAAGLAAMQLVLKPILPHGESPVKSENTQNPPDALPPASTPASAT
ncbi:MAG: hypothetical protein US89_C0001G0003 [Candidatus Peregrinibacteria bacterium GW2011_GWF2_38_29]|nr:MAG: hypothetical protein US89_C0001G0003 [Candidatus Peregrinibacteria bacterium GW2011_GWF2_38_29]